MKRRRNLRACKHGGGAELASDGGARCIGPGAASARTGDDVAAPALSTLRGAVRRRRKHWHVALSAAPGHGRVRSATACVVVLQPTVGGRAARSVGRVASERLRARRPLRRVGAHACIRRHGK